ADDWREVMLAMRLEADVAQHDQLVIAVHLRERAGQEGDGIDVVAGEEFLIGAHHPVGRADETLTLRVVAGPAQQRADSLLGLLAAGFAAGALGAGGLAWPAGLRPPTAGFGPRATASPTGYPLITA